jgi:hypothetical protein
MDLIRCCKRLVLWHTNWSCLHLHEYTQFFHVSCLKKVIGDKIPVQTIFPELDEEGKIILEPEAITNTRIRQLRKRSISEYLIKWRKLPAEDSTWKMSLLYRSIQSYSSVADNTCLKGRGMLIPNVGSLPLNWGILY